MKTIEITIKNYGSNIEVFGDYEDGIGRIYTATTDSDNYPYKHYLPHTRELMHVLNAKLQRWDIRISQKSAKEIADAIAGNCHWL